MLFLDIFINDNTRGINFFSQQTLKFQSISEEIILQPFFFVYIILYYMPNFRIAKYHSPPRSTKDETQKERSFKIYPRAKLHRRVVLLRVN